MVELYTIPAGIPDNLDRDRPIVLIDVFRASTSITAALAAGAAEIYVAGSREEASLLKKHLGDGALLAGEREGFKIEGYDLGNSPLEMTAGRVKDRPIIFNSTNGTKLIRRFEDFDSLIIGSIVSLTAATEYLRRFEVDPVFCCAATQNRFSTEDVVAAGMMIKKLDRPENDLHDASLAAVRLVDAAGTEWHEWSKSSFHGRYLASIGLGDDLDFCLDLDRFGFVPIKEGDRIIRSDAE